MKIIGIAGRARAGKNTTGEILKRTLDHSAEYRPYLFAFADAVKLTAQQMFALTDDETWKDCMKEKVHPYWGITMREMFQKVGTEGGRDIFGDNLWVDRLRLRLAQLEETVDENDKENIFIITDVRFPNEVDFIHMEGGTVWWIDREDDSLSESSQAHSSENAISVLDGNLVIPNDDTIDTLAKEVTHALKTYVLD